VVLSLQPDGNVIKLVVPPVGGGGGVVTKVVFLEQATIVVAANKITRVKNDIRFNLIEFSIMI
jgi:hypothetical protein